MNINTVYNSNLSKDDALRKGPKKGSIQEEMQDAQSLERPLKAMY